VVVESPRRFRDVFGRDPELAWDEARGALRRAHLGGAVEAFFANGGLRCWIVRVADRAAVAHHRFTLPGVIAAGDRHSAPAPLAAARARAAGSWCEALAVSTALVRDPLPLQGAAGAGAMALAPGAYHVDLAVDRSRLRPGDLLEITVDPAAPALLLFAERVVPIPGGVRVLSAGVDGTGATIGAFWAQPPVAGSPALAVEDIETTPPVPIPEAAAVPAVLAALGSPPLRPTVRRLSFEILVWQGNELHRQLSDLTFGSRHPRFWATLPTDDELFRVPPEEPRGLARDVSSPRFPLAGPETSDTYYLPWGMGRVRTPDAAVRLDAGATGASNPLERDGLARFGAGLFVDERLAPVGSGALLGEAEYRLYVAGLPLSGVHSLLPIEDASLVAVPDAVHRGWSRELPPVRMSLGAPELDPVAAPDAAGRSPLSWTEVDGAGAYTLQHDVDPAFSTPVTAFEGDARGAAIALPERCPEEIFFRVRAFTDGEVGPWSNTRAARLPGEAFAPCEPARPPSLVLDFTGDAASPAPALTWTTADPFDTLPADWTIEEATDPGFSAAAELAPEGMFAGYAALPERRVAARYYRVRGRSGTTYGPWSNTVLVGPTERAAFTEAAASAFDAAPLLATHRALLRFAAARGDFLALLSLPDHYRAGDALEHAGRLTPGGDEEEPAPAPSSPLSPRVAPLTLGEAPVLSYGALHHPWTVSRTSDAAGDFRRLPPDGAVAGVLAALALERGAWRAAANQPLAGVVSLEPDLRAAPWGRLVEGGVNLLVNSPRGFLARSEDTLGGERTLNRIHVRRLMILLRRLALREGQRAVFEPHGLQLQRRVRQHFERLLGELFHRGAFEGRDAADAFHVVTDETINPPASMEQGRLFVELRVAPAAALTFLTVRLVTAGPGRLAVEEG
jgi:hypothetical protein